MRDKGLVFDELGKVRRTLGARGGERWMELALRIAVLFLAVTVAVARCAALRRP